eukprot:m.156483 g.156483  ORF g.156483 m.156483 type:complete len:670 (+) comp38689_c0_seq1:116-2125(+)
MLLFQACVGAASPEPYAKLQAYKSCFASIVGRLLIILTVFTQCLQILSQSASSAGHLTVTFSSTNKIKIGKSILISCIWSTSPNEQNLQVTQWKFQEKAINETNSHYFFLDKKRSIYIFKTLKSDEGVYDCYATFHQTRFHANGHLVVVVPPTVIPVNKTIIIGQTAMLECRGENVDIFSWNFRGKYLHTDLRYTVYTRQVKIPNVKLSDAGQYTCTAVNKWFTRPASVTLTVLLPPNITEVPQNKSVSVGDYFTLRCSAKALPKANIRWIQNGRVIRHQRWKYIIEKLDDVSLLTILNSSSVDGGWYTCECNNSAGEQSARALVRVHPRMAKLFVLHTKVVFILKSNQTIQCSSPGKQSQWKLSYLWSRDGMPLYALDQRDRVLLRENGQVSFNNVSYNDTGLYECKATLHSSFLTTCFWQEEFNVSIEGPPDPPVLKPTRLLVSSDTVTAFLNWSRPFDGKSKLLYFLVGWKSVEMELSWIHLFIESDQTSASLRLPIASKLTNYTFYVEATNIHGAARSNIEVARASNFQIITKVTPSMIPHTTNMESAASSESSANPRSTIPEADPTEWGLKSVLLLLSSVTLVTILAAILICYLIFSKCHHNRKRHSRWRCQNRAEPESETVESPPPPYRSRNSATVIVNDEAGNRVASDLHSHGSQKGTETVL